MQIHRPSANLRVIVTDLLTSIKATLKDMSSESSSSRSTDMEEGEAPQTPIMNPTNTNALLKRKCMSEQHARPQQRLKFDDAVIAQKEILDASVELCSPKISENDLTEMLTKGALTQQECYEHMKRDVDVFISNAYQRLFETMIPKETFGKMYTCVMNNCVKENIERIGGSMRQTSEKLVGDDVRAHARRYNKLKQDMELSTEDILMRLQAYDELKDKIKELEGAIEKMKAARKAQVGEFQKSLHDFTSKFLTE